ncbi:protein obstructor-E [Neocloeon triangulifer]|uniref:protein obstructor-E n=1 Tax=Neocloeon triangulifer TaxID=2078957 RepID=UPI00286F8DC1|nr:protein obstructor-E [Neocloeon triangulifer]
MSRIWLPVLLGLICVYAQQCPEKNGRFADPRQCDKYIECEDGVATEKLCPDGLLFNDKARFFSYPCSYPTDVDCTGREATQPPQPSGDCPHQFGYFRMGADATQCGQFMNCADGRGYVFDCPEGLAFDSTTLQCNWPDLVAECDAEGFLGFTCPEEKVSSLGPAGFSASRYFRSPDNDCTKYFICENNRPRMYRCGVGRAFNEFINTCDGPENVTGCA